MHDVSYRLVGDNSLAAFREFPKHEYLPGTKIEEIELQPIDHPREFQSQAKMPVSVPVLRDAVYGVSIWKEIGSAMDHAEREPIFAYIGWWLRQHYRKIARKSSTQSVATRLRKQGIPLHVALNILVY